MDSGLDMRDRGEPTVDLDTAKGYALAEALPMIRFWNRAKREFGEAACEGVREVFADHISTLASEHGDRTDDLYASEEIEAYLWEYETGDDE